MAQFGDQVVVVTGAGSGIGRDVAHAFADLGASVVVTDVNDEDGETVVTKIADEGGEAMYVHADVTAIEDVEEMIERTIEEYGRLDHAVNNAGIGGKQVPTGEYDEDSWRQVIDVNLNGVWRCMRAELDRLVEQSDGGTVVNMASVLGLVGFEGAPAYVAAKHGVVGLTKAAALEYADQGIRVNAVCPGFVETPLLAAGGITEDEEVRKQIEGLHAMNRLGQPAEIADAVLWACSDGASFLTGETITVDGGYTSR